MVLKFMRGTMAHGKTEGLDKAFVEATPGLRSNTRCEHAERNVTITLSAVATSSDSELRYSNKSCFVFGQTTERGIPTLTDTIPRNRACTAEYI